MAETKAARRGSPPPRHRPTPPHPACLPSAPSPKGLGWSARLGPPHLLLRVSGAHSPQAATADRIPGRSSCRPPADGEVQARDLLAAPGSRACREEAGLSQGIKISPRAQPNPRRWRGRGRSRLHPDPPLPGAAVTANPSGEPAVGAAGDSHSETQQAILVPLRRPGPSTQSGGKPGGFLPPPTPTQPGR